MNTSANKDDTQLIRFQCGSCDRTGQNTSDMEMCYKNRHDVLECPVTAEDDGKKHTQYAIEIMEKHYFATLRDTQETLFYQNGVYKNGAETIVNEECEKSIPNCTSYLRREVLKTIQARTYVDRREFDKDPYILNVKNGLFNIKTGEFQKHNPYILCRTQFPVNYNPKSAPIRFVRFMMECLPDFKDRNTVYEEFASILLRNNIRFEKAYMYVGGGANGKSTFLNVIETIIGKDNISNVSIHDLIYGRFSRARLDGKSANIYADISNDELDRIGVLKAVVSGDPIDVEKKGRDGFKMINYAKMFYSCNQLPEINEDTDAVYRRFMITHWTEQFKGAKDNRNLIHDLITDEELSGILNLLIVKAKYLLAQKKLTYDQSTEQLRIEWKEKADHVNMFCVNNLERKENSIAVKSDVYSQYVYWCQNRNIIPKTDRQFTEKMKSFGFKDNLVRVRQNTVDPKGKPTRVWESVTLVTPVTHPVNRKTNENNDNSLCLPDTDERNNVTSVTKGRLCRCKTCGGGGEFYENTVGSAGMTIKSYHESLNHELEYLEGDSRNV